MSGEGTESAPRSGSLPVVAVSSRSGLGEDGSSDGFSTVAGAGTDRRRAAPNVLDGGRGRGRDGLPLRLGNRVGRGGGWHPLGPIGRLEALDPSEERFG